MLLCIFGGFQESGQSIAIYVKSQTQKAIEPAGNINE